MTESLPLVHIGMAKSASTFLQQVVLPNLPDYFYIGKHHNTPELAQALSAMVRRTSLDWNPNVVSETISEAAQANANGRPLLFSEEDCSVFKFLDPKEIAERLRITLGPYNVLMIVRTPETWIDSQYMFRLSTYHPDTLFGAGEWFDRHRFNVGIGSDISEIRFGNLARVYRQICRGRVTIIPYELLVKDKSEFVRRLAEALQVETEHVQNLFDTPRNRRRDKTRITQRDADFIRLARFIQMHDLETFWKQVEVSIDDVPETRETEAYVAMKSLTEQNEFRFRLWRKHLISLRSHCLRHLQQGPTASDPLEEDQIGFLRQVSRRQKAILNDEFGIDLDEIVPASY